VNLFYLHEDPQICASMHCDKHVVKMIIETAQLLSTAVRTIEPNAPNVYKTSHLNHPSARWVRANAQNYRWATLLLKFLGEEYERRYGKRHKTIREVYGSFAQYEGRMPAGEFYPPPQVVPEQHKRDDTVEAYRSYYHDKLSFIFYKKGGWPEWLAQPEREI